MTERCRVFPIHYMPPFIHTARYLLLFVVVSHWVHSFIHFRVYRPQETQYFAVSWWRHQMETFSALLALCAGNSPHKGQWRGALMFSVIDARIKGWVNSREAGDLRRDRTHYDVIAMVLFVVVIWPVIIVLGWSIHLHHYSDVIMGAVASQITIITIVFSTVYSDADQRKHQSSASLAFGLGIHQGPVNSPHKWPVMWNTFPFDDVIIAAQPNTYCGPGINIL